MSKMDDKKIDDALAAWPAIGGHADEAAAAKTMTKIRANFPPKSKLSITDDALVAAPFPATAEEWADEKAAAEEKSSQIDVPMARASSIPPPSSGVSRSERNQGAADADTPSKVEAGMGQVERQRERTSFKDLAKLAATPPPSSTKPASAKIPVATPSSPLSSASGDSGVVDLQAAALSDPQGADRAKSTPLASGSLFDDDAPRSVPPPSMSGAHSAAGPLSAVQSVPQQIDPYAPASVRPSAPPSLGSTLASAGPHSAVAALGSQRKVEAKKSSPVLAILGGLVAVSAIAAGALFVVKTHRAAPVAAAQPVAQAAAQDTTPAQQQATPDQATAKSDTAPQAIAQNDTQNSAPAVVGKSAKHAAATSKPSASKSSGGDGNALAAAMEKDTSSTPPAPPPADAKTTDTPPSGTSADLQNAMKTAVGPTDSSGGDTKAAPTGPKFAPGSVPQRPSQGALASAIGRVLPGARSCLGPDDGVSYATIVFESAGDTQNVTLSGFAANKPAGACITTALKKANVGPFAESTYSAKVTVRP